MAKIQGPSASVHQSGIGAWSPIPVMTSPKAVLAKPR